MSQASNREDIRAEAAAEKIHKAEVKAKAAIAAKPAVPKPLTKQEQFIKLIDALRQKVTGMQLNKEYTRILLEDIDQIVKFTDG